MCTRKLQINITVCAHQLQLNKLIHRSSFKLICMLISLKSFSSEGYHSRQKKILYFSRRNCRQYVEQMRIHSSKFSVNITYENWITVQIKYRYVILLRCHNQISITTQIPWPFPDIGPLPWPLPNSQTFPGFQKFQNSNHPQIENKFS